MTDQLRCDWDTGTAFIGPRKCGRPAKHRVTSKSHPGQLRYVCGIHARSVRAWNYGELEPIEARRG